MSTTTIVQWMAAHAWVSYAIDAALLLNIARMIYNYRHPRPPKSLRSFDDWKTPQTPHEIKAFLEEIPGFTVTIGDEGPQK